MNRLRLLVETYYDYQKGRVAYSNRLNRLPEEAKKLIEQETLFKEISTNLNNLEKSLIKAIENEVKKEPIYEKFLSKIKGIGPVMGADLIAWACTERDFVLGKTHPMLEQIKQLPYAKIEDLGNVVRVKMPSVLSVAKYPSDFYKYCGLIPNSKRKRGETISYNPKMKTLFWKIVRQILMARKSHYVVLYKVWKNQYYEKYKNETKTAKMKAHLTAVKKVARHLAFSLYLAYKYLNGEPAYLPYAVNFPPHTLEPPFIDGEDGKPEYLSFLVDYAKKFSSKGD